MKSILLFLTIILNSLLCTIQISVQITPEELQQILIAAKNSKGRVSAFTLHKTGIEVKNLEDNEQSMTHKERVILPDEYSKQFDYYPNYYDYIDEYSDYIYPYGMPVSYQYYPYYY